LVVVEGKRKYVPDRTGTDPVGVRWTMENIYSSATDPADGEHTRTDEGKSNHREDRRSHRPPLWALIVRSAVAMIRELRFIVQPGPFCLFCRKDGDHIWVSFLGLFRSRDKPQNRTTGSAYSFFFGNSSAGKRVNERSAMQMTAVYSCVRILAEAVADCRSTSTANKEDGGKEKAIDHPLYLLLHDEPKPEDEFFRVGNGLMTTYLSYVG